MVSAAFTISFRTIVVPPGINRQPPERQPAFERGPNRVGRCHPSELFAGLRELPDALRLEGEVQQLYCGLGHVLTYPGRPRP